MHEKYNATFFKILGWIPGVRLPGIAACSYVAVLRCILTGWSSTSEYNALIAFGFASYLTQQALYRVFTFQVSLARV